MSDQIEKDFDETCREISSKVRQAIELLRDAGAMATKIGVTTDYYGDMSELKELVEELQPTDRGWDRSNWCAN